MKKMMPRMVLFGDKFSMLWNLSIYLGTLWELRIICYCKDFM